MGENEQHLSVGEFERGLTRFERVVEARFDRIETRFDRLDEKVDGHSERIVALETVAQRRTRKAATWGAATAGFVMAVWSRRTVFEGFRAYLR